MIPMLIGAGVAAGSQAIAQNQRDKSAKRGSREMMGIQFQNQKALDDHGFDLQKRMWEETNYSAQQAQLKKQD